MKKLLFLLVFITLCNCASVPMFNDYSYTKGWAHREIPPSQAVRNGEVIFDGKLSDGRSFSISDDGSLNAEDRMYYYNALYQDFGWRTNVEGEWSSYGGIIPLKGHIYINLKRGVAVYFYPDDTFYTFKLKVND